MPIRNPVSVRHDGPLVTIAIPTFNRAALLKECVAAALAQTYQNFEILVSDNASPDETSEVLRGFADERLRVIRQPSNIGLMPNWNACVAAARGEYLVLVCDDDQIDPWLLERCVAILAGRPQVPIVVGLSNLHSTALNHTFAARRSRHLQTGIVSGTDILLAYLKNEIGVIASCSVMCRTDVLQHHGGFPMGFPHTADIAAWAPLLFLGEAGFLNEACATWTSHDDSATKRLGVEVLLRDGWQVAGLISALAEQHAPDDETRRLIKFHSRRCFAGRALTALSEYRRSGGGLQSILNFVWQFRRELSRVDLTAALKLGATILCPRPIADRVRRLKHT
jgi:cellulose synthase/poly-beta-1,6-N-acetylglucosamine synthase-like glycosyltransferase